MTAEDREKILEERTEANKIYQVKNQFRKGFENVFDAGTL